MGVTYLVDYTIERQGLYDFKSTIIKCESEEISVVPHIHTYISRRMKRSGVLVFAAASAAASASCDSGSSQISSSSPQVGAYITLHNVDSNVFRLHVNCWHWL